MQAARCSLVLHAAVVVGAEVAVGVVVVPPCPSVRVVAEDVRVVTAAV